jgi:hypothetical protein
MGARWLGAVVLVAACYSPAVHPGAPCGPGDSCPSGLVCEANVCVVPGTGSAMPDAWDMVLDTPPDTSSATPMDAPADGTPAYVPWGTPAVIASLNAISGQGEDDPTFTSNKLTVIETSNSPDDLYECTRPAIGQAFTCTIITVLNSTSDDRSPEISADGLTLYFTSNRSGTNQAYTSTKVNGLWTTPVLNTQLSASGSPGDIAISPDGLTAIVDEDAATQNHFIMYTRASTTATWANPVTHTELEVTTDIAAPSITNNGAVIYFHAGGTRDIYTAKRMANGTYTTPVPVTEPNTASRDAAPFVSADDKYMMFERAGDIYETSRP